MSDERRQTSILVVDDDPAILSAVADVLAMDGYTVRTASNGATALQQIDEAVPGLILLDMRMPVLDGWAFASEVRRRGLAPPIVVMTAAHDAAVWAREIDADGILSKPFEIVELLDVVEHHAVPAAPES